MRIISRIVFISFSHRRNAFRVVAGFILYGSRLGKNLLLDLSFVTFVTLRWFPPPPSAEYLPFTYH